MGLLQLVTDMTRIMEFLFENLIRKPFSFALFDQSSCTHQLFKLFKSLVQFWTNFMLDMQKTNFWSNEKIWNIFALKVTP